MQIKTCSTFNPDTFLPEQGTEVTHDCQCTIAQTCAARENLKETPVENPEQALLAHRSSFVEQGTCKAKYAVVTLPLHPKQQQAPPPIRIENPTGRINSLHPGVGAQ